MGIFGFGKKKEQNSGCCCGAACTPEAMAQTEDAKQAGGRVKVLGAGCAKCNALEAVAVEALTALGQDTAVEHVTDFSQIASYGVMTTPALVVDGKVVCYGKVPGKDETIALMRKAGLA